MVAPAPAPAPVNGTEFLDDRVAPAVRSVAGWLAEDTGQAATLLAVAAGLFLALLLLRRGVQGLVRRAIPSPVWREHLAEAVGRTGGWFLALASLRIVAGTGSMPPVLARLVLFLFTVAAVVQVALWVQSLLMGLLRARSERADDDTALALMRGLLTAAVWIVAALTLLANLGVNITGLIAGLGIGGIAIGLAAQGVLSDLFAAFAIVFDKPFRRGDSIAYEPGAIGVVEEIGIKSTRIRAISGELVIMSNAKLLGATVANYAAFERRRVMLRFGVIYETPPERLEAIPALVREAVEAAPKAVFDRCHLTGFGASSLDFELVFFVEDPALVTMMDSRQEVILGIIRAFADHDIAFAYPVQVEMLAGPDGRIIDPRETAPASPKRAARGA
ncbi:MAG: mechanosensitive ion channel family protein [Thermaurantiacus tibetensis]|uniref:mechanosensitive ion channel family protein n=1 Tax=Thermaurantiacus tibetensis TaxID=2759035 RepID=UPI00188E42A4|nr:mechanosensitive ion channel domain-containing protein [Thermaurantiacus tibetensis]